MNAADPAPAPAPALPRRRWWRLLLVVLACLLVAALAVRVLLPPERALRLILSSLEPTLGLRIEFDGKVDYRLRGTPQLVVRDVTARMPGESTPLLRAERALLSLPWKTIRSRGRDLEIGRVELDAPHVHLPTLLRWLDARPPGDGKLPAFTNGLRVVRGRIDADGWHVDDIDLDLPSLHADRPLDARIAGTAVTDALRVPFRLRVRSDRVVDAREFGAVGTLSVETGDGRLQATVQADATRADTASGLRLSPLRIAGDARWRSGDTDLPFALGLHGDLTVDGGVVRVAPAGIAVRADGVVPTLAAGGAIVFDRQLVLALDGQLPHWPEAWPALPSPLGDSDAPLPFALRYAGPPTFDAPIGLKLSHAGASFDGSARIADLVAWLDTGEDGSPLPPLRGTLRAERIEMSGVRLEGIEIEFDDGGDDGDVPAAPAARP
ncbi:hypothetical protein LDO26_14565 [Luteimonas sp. BDR2-5]|uniref:hypothetical protein n=1 Tax=Proluteimonas luteida TaxID=2878685 RepID=UPI001E536D7D|nr:hypothetical protein [Luteimonas sp. BDR2-5]MCD9029415.1 hypothetical protein [Luteimonas sp. BDR2-5]